MAPPRRIALIGAGMMGAGLARLFGRIGWPVAVWDRDAGALARLCGEVAGVRVGADLADAVAGADLVIEAVSEQASVKQAVFAALAAAASQRALLATNSSVISVAVVAANVADASRVLGMHFWNPADLIPLVEVIQGPRTADASIAAAMTLLTDAGREPVHVRRDAVPGNRLQHALWREAIALVEEGVCAPEDIDTIVKRGFGARLAVLGPLENADLVGLSLTRQIHEVVLPTLSRADAPSAALTEREARGELGVATGNGFHRGWTVERVAALRARLRDHLELSFANKQFNTAGAEES